MLIKKGKCHSCKYRHDCCPHPYPWNDEVCKHWKLGRCYTCKYLHAPDDDWFVRGCETWCFGGCRKYKRSWKQTFELWKKLRKHDSFEI